MKRFVNIVLALFGVFMLVPSCEKAPFVTMTCPRNFSFTREGGTQSFTFTCNRDWSVTSSESWLRISPAAGAKSENEISVTITCSPNSTYNPRNATITIRIEELTETISVTQETGIGLIVSPSTFDLTNAEQTINIEVTANVEFEVYSEVDWIKTVTTKALTPSFVTLSIDANEGYSNRCGTIIIKQKDGNLSSTVLITQAQTNYWEMTPQEGSVSYEGGSVKVSVITNHDYNLSVSDGIDWVIIGEKVEIGANNGLTTYEYTIIVSETDAIVTRNAFISGKNHSGETLGVFCIVQSPQPILEFENEMIMQVCISKFDTNKDGAISLKEANSVTSIESNFFGDYAKSIESFNDLAKFKNVTVIENRAFSMCRKLRELSLPEALTEIRGSAFDYCEKLSIISLPSNLKYLGQVAFRQCVSLKEVIIPDSVQELGSSLFHSCSNLERVVLPEGITTIPGSLFILCTSLRDIVIPKSVITIETYAFWQCYRIEQIIIPANVEFIARGAFWACNSLKKVYSMNRSAPVLDNAEPVFNGIPEDAILYVPKGCIEEYASWAPTFGGGVYEME